MNLVAAVQNETVSFLDPPQAPGELGRLGSYRILGRLGSGGMAVVLLAEDVHLHRQIALKVLLPELAAHPVARERFLREARATASLTNDHIVAIHQVGEERGLVYLAMPLLPGHSLEEHLRQNRLFTIPEILRFGCEVALGLSAAHERGLIHRDIKPPNIWLEELPLSLSADFPTLPSLALDATRVSVPEVSRERVKILDFGLVWSPRNDTTLTQKGMILGTPAYMAPEQARGDAVDGRSDLFSLGVLLYRMSTGRLPFQADTVMATLAAVALETPPLPSDLNPELPARLEILIMQLLEKDPALRPPSADIVACWLKDIENLPESVGPSTRILPASAAEAGSPGLSARPRRRWRGVFFGMATVVMLSLIGLALIKGMGKTGRPDLEPPIGENEPGAVLPPKENPPELLLNPPEEQKPETLLATFSRDPLWQPGKADDSLPGLLAHPAKVDGISHWQLESVAPRAGINAVAWSPDGRKIACACGGGEIRIYDVPSLRLFALLVGHSESVLSVAWSADGEWLASGSADHTVRLWQKDGTPGRVLEGHTDAVTAVTFGPDGSLASAGKDHTINLWQKDTKITFREHTGPIFCLAWDRHGLASGGDDGTVRVWQPGPKTTRVNKQDVPGKISGLAWNRDGRLAISTNTPPPMVMVWRPGQPVESQFYLKGPKISAIGWRNDGRLLLARGPDGRPAVQSFTTQGEPAQSFSDSRANCLAVSPDGSWMACASRDNHLQLWQQDGKPGPRLRGPVDSREGVNALAWSPDGQILACAARGSALWMWNREGRPMTLTPRHRGAIRSLAWAPDSKRLATGGDDHEVRVWGEDGNQTKEFIQHKSSVVGVAWSGNGLWLASVASEDQIVRVWKLLDGSPGPEFLGAPNGNRCVAWRPDSRGLAVGGSDGVVRLAELDQENVDFKNVDYIEPRLEQGEIRCVSWHRDGERLIWGGSTENFLNVWDVRHSQASLYLGAHTDVRAAAWNAQGTQLAVAAGNDVWMLNSKSRQLEPTARGTRGEVQRIAWHPDGKRFVSGGRDGTLRYWDETGQPLGLTFLIREGQSATFDATGRLVVGDSEVVDDAFVCLVPRKDGALKLVKPSAFRDLVEKGNDPGVRPADLSIPANK